MLIHNDCVKRVEEDKTGVLKHNRSKIDAGLVVFHTVVGNKVVAINMDGDVVIEFDKAPEGYELYRPARPGQRASITSILTSKRNRDNRIIAEINRDGELIWKTRERWFTHDWHQIVDNQIISVVRQNREVGDYKFSDTSIVELDTNGRVRWTWSLWDHIDETQKGSEVRANLNNGLTTNPFHINSIQYSDRPPALKAFGEPIIVASARNMNSILVVGRRTKKYYTKFTA